MADIVRDILDNSARQRKVIFQQKKPLLNYELNLAQDILREGLEELTRVSIGDNFSGEAFQVDPDVSPSALFIRKGTFYHNGVPLTLTSDIRISNPTMGAPGSGTRFDLVYALWKINQIDSATDPVIGFATTQEQQVELEIIYEANTTVPTNVPSETITFSSSDKGITLTKGQFPDWMRIPGTRFKTNALNNTGSPFLTVGSSPTDKKIIVEEAIVSGVASDVRFLQYDASLSIPKEFRAFRDNIVILALIERVASNHVIDKKYIKDMRSSMANNFVIKGCQPTYSQTSPSLVVTVSPGEFSVGGDKEFLEEGITWTATVTDNSLNYLYLSTSGTLQVSTVEPTDFHVMLAEVLAKSGVITNLHDIRQFRPCGGGGDGQGNGEALTGANSVSHNFTAAENISAFDLVYLDGSGRVRKSSASNKNTLPVVAMATQSTSVGERNTFVTFGVISNPSPSNLSAGDDLFADTTPGGMVNNIGVQAIGDQQYVQRIGVVINSKEIFFSPEMTTIKKDASAESSLIVLRPNGELEVMSPTDRISPDRLNFLASAAQIPVTTSFDILPGRYFVEGSLSKWFDPILALPSGIVNMGTAGTTYKTSPITSGHYNKAFFTLDRDGVVKMYEGVSNSLASLVEDPVVPDGEMPLSLIKFMDNGLGLAGSISPITSSDIIDKRPWLNLGSVEDTAFQAIYRSPTKVLVQRGEAWISKKYITLPQNVEISVPAVDDSYYFYLNLSAFGNNEPNLNHIANSSHFVASTSLPTQVHRRDYILLAQFTVSSGEIYKVTFKTYKSKFWDFQDIPFYGEQIWDLAGVVAAGTSFFTNSNDTPDHLAAAYQFTNADYLDVMINGDKVFEGNDFTKAGLDDVVVLDRNGIKFLYDLPPGAEIRIRKI